MVAFVKTPVVLDGPLKVQPSNLPPFFILFFLYFFGIKKSSPHPQVAFSGEPSKVQLGKGSPIGGLGLAVVVGEAVVDGAASCGEIIY